MSEPSIQRFFTESNRVLVSTFFVLVFVVAISNSSRVAAGTCTVSWIGSSFGGADKWVQQDIEDICVASDGAGT